MVNKEDYVDLGWTCNTVCTTLDRGLKGNSGKNIVIDTDFRGTSPGLFRESKYDNLHLRIIKSNSLLSRCTLISVLFLVAGSNTTWNNILIESWFPCLHPSVPRSRLPVWIIEAFSTCFSRLMIGGCLKAFTRMGALKRHVDNPNVSCVGHIRFYHTSTAHPGSLRSPGEVPDHSRTCRATSWSLTNFPGSAVQYLMYAFF